MSPACLRKAVYHRDDFGYLVVMVKYGTTYAPRNAAGQTVYTWQAPDAIRYVVWSE